MASKFKAGDWIKSNSDYARGHVHFVGLNGELIGQWRSGTHKAGWDMRVAPELIPLLKPMTRSDPKFTCICGATFDPQKAEAGEPLQTPVCECGAASVGSPAHSHWCPLNPSS